MTDNVPSCTRCGGRVHLDAQDCGPAVGGVLPSGQELADAYRDAMSAPVAMTDANIQAIRDLLPHCPGTVKVVLEHQGWEGRPYMQSEVYGLNVECSLIHCYWVAPGFDDYRVTEITRTQLDDLQALHDRKTQKDA